MERTALSTIKGLLNRGVKVTLLTWPCQNWPISHIDLRIVQLGIHWGNRFLKSWMFNWAVNRYLSTNPFEYIFSFDRASQFTHLHAGGGTHKTFLRIKNESSNIAVRMFRKASLFHAYTLYMEKKGFSNPRLKKVRCNSNLVKDDIRQNYYIDQDKLQVIHSSIDWKEIGTAFQQKSIIATELYRRHDISPEWKCLLFLGSGFSRKGLDIAIEGLRVLPESYHLVVVGKGSPRIYLSRALKLGLLDRVHFLGAQEKGWKYASICKALVLASFYEPFGGAAAEAQAMGLPVLVSDKNGYMDWVIPGKNGLILESPITNDKIHNAFKRLVELIENPKMTPEQIRQYIKDLDNEVILEKLINEFLEI
ncbi:MAG TPA: glycosyltransferase family 4 protein [Desulfatiglandales bacterium]|nr:glycosyltransferase family 4 protein [Desulfatiglandales bacterium]